MSEEIKHKVYGVISVLVTSGLTFLLSSFFNQYARTETVSQLEGRISNMSVKFQYIEENLKDIRDDIREIKTKTKGR